MHRVKIPLSILAVFIIAVLLSACAPAQTPAPTTREEVPRITADELKERLDNGEELFIGDTRDAVSYSLQHIAGAESFPTAEVKSKMEGLDPDQVIVLYCTWPDEETSAGAALTLYENGFDNVYALLGGLAAWRDAGYPVEGSAG